MSAWCFRHGPDMNQTNLQFKTLLLLLALVTIAFIWILLPFYGAVFWAVILGIIFAPMQRRFQQRFGWNRNLTSLATLTVCLIIAILPVIITSALLVQEGATLYKNVESGKLDVAGYIEQFKNFLPPYFQHLLDRFGMGNLEGLREKIVKSAMQGSQFFATQAFSFGQGTFDFLVSFFIMLYLLFFLLRDGPELVRKVRTAVPLAEPQKRRLQLKFNRVVRATVKGNVLVAVTQGALGGLYLLVPGHSQRAALGGVDGVSVAAAGGGRGDCVGAGGGVLPAERVDLAGRGARVVRGICDRAGGQCAKAHPGGQGHPHAGLPDPYLNFGRPVDLWLERLCHRATDCCVVHVQLGAVCGNQTAGATALGMKAMRHFDRQGLGGR
ncbi:putative PurR-regulated permease PerM [Pseudomonas sp. W2I6]|nr:putative PurR-regulated permease PerM [Pseudomonas sp. W2I6]